MVVFHIATLNYPAWCILYLIMNMFNVVYPSHSWLRLSVYLLDVMGFRIHPRSRYGGQEKFSVYVTPHPPWPRVSQQYFFMWMIHVFSLQNSPKIPQNCQALDCCPQKHGDDERCGYDQATSSGIFRSTWFFTSWPFQPSIQGHNSPPKRSQFTTSNGSLWRSWYWGIWISWFHPSLEKTGILWWISRQAQELQVSTSRW